MEPADDDQTADGTDAWWAVTLVDTNVFVDVWSNDPRWGSWSASALERTAARGPLAINPIIYTELCLGFERETGQDHCSEKEYQRPFEECHARKSRASAGSEGGRREAAGLPALPAVGC